MKIIIFLAIAMGSVLMQDAKIQAEEENIKSRGSFNSIIDFYSEDITYLESEIKQLLDECK